MNTDPVGFRYTDDEIAVLRLILSLGTPLGCAQRSLDESAYRKAFARLTDSQIITPSGTSAYIDKLTAMLLTEISNAGKCLRIISQERVTLLFCCPHLCIIEEIAGGIHTVIPHRTVSDAGADLTETLSRHIFPAEAALIDSADENAAAYDAPDHDALLRAVNELLTSITL